MRGDVNHTLSAPNRLGDVRFDSVAIRQIVALQNLAPDCGRGWTRRLRVQLGMPDGTVKVYQQPRYCGGKKVSVQHVRYFPSQLQRAGIVPSVTVQQALVTAEELLVATRNSISSVLAGDDKMNFGRQAGTLS